MTTPGISIPVTTGAAGDGRPGDDAALLRAFVESGDSAAFEAMVRRHGPMVLGVCLRILHHRQDAEDAFQAVFVVLARRADCVRPAEKIAGWLYGVAHRTALKARAMRATRQEKEAMWQNRAPSGGNPDPQCSDLGPILDQELMRLPEQQRLPLILNVFEGRSKAGIAATLGIAEGTVSSRLARAREALRARLVRRGISLTAAALASALAANAGAAVSEGLIVQTTQTAAIAVAASSAALPAGIAALSKGVLHAMFMSKVKVIVAWALAILVVGTGSGVMIYSAVAKDAADKPGKTAVDPGAQLRGGIISVDGDNLTIGTMEDGQKVQKTVTLVGDGGITLAPDSKGAEAMPGKREHLKPGTSVTITLDADGKTVRAIQVQGRGTNGTIEAIDKDTFTLISKGKDGEAKSLLRFNEATVVTLSHGKEKGDVKYGTVADLKPGMRVSVSLSANEKDMARSITVQPPAPPKPEKAK